MYHSIKGQAPCREGLSRLSLAGRRVRGEDSSICLAPGRATSQQYRVSQTLMLHCHATGRKEVVNWVRSLVVGRRHGHQHPAHLHLGQRVHRGPHKGHADGKAQRGQVRIGCPHLGCQEQRHPRRELHPLLPRPTPHRERRPVPQLGAEVRFARRERIRKGELSLRSLACSTGAAQLTCDWTPANPDHLPAVSGRARCRDPGAR